jgi:hypothetical protein
LEQKHYSEVKCKRDGWQQLHNLYWGIYTQQDVCCPERGYSYLDLKALLETFEE